MKQLAFGIVCACGLAAAACAGSTGPTNPTSSLMTTGGGGTAVSAMAGSAATGGTKTASPMAGSAATGVARAIAQCQGPVLQTLEEVFSSRSTPIVMSDDGHVAIVTFSNAGRTFTLGVAYLDNDGSGGLSCGDTVTSVGTTD